MICEINFCLESYDSEINEIVPDDELGDEEVDLNEEDDDFSDEDENLEE